ncbi:unnamed protein product [Orchesella dallaii]|uniref:C2H2-type domain-containing protein n=1 Tax=Orchesella dallaii TaxID=48710 RepID=A0ABP1PPR8_9HEXA
MANANCIFCAGSVPPSCGIDRKGNVIRSELRERGPILISDETEEDHPIADHLSTFFILQQILEIPNSFLAQLLALCDGDSKPEYWVDMCAACLGEVNTFYEMKRTISSFQVEMKRIGTTLKERIELSRDSKGGGPIWLGIRSKVLGDEGLAGFMYKGENGGDSPGEIRIIMEEMQEDEEEEEIEGEEMELSLDELADTPSSTLSMSFPSPLTNPLPETHSLPDPEQLQPQAPIFIDLVDSDDEIEETQNNSLHNPPSNHPKSQPRSGPALKKRMSKRMDNSNPDYIAYSIGNKRFFECRHCAYHGQRFEWMSKHLSVHDEGSDAVQCEECFWVIFPRRVPLHYRIHHRDLPIPQKGRDGKYQSVKNSNVKLQQFVDLYATKVGVSKMDYRCSECVASFTSLEACQVHAKRHIKPTYEWCKV